MRWILYGVIIVLALIAPVAPLDVAKLQPVEAVAVRMENGRVILETDTEDRGEGATAAEALADMKNNATSVIYLDTAEYLMVEEGAEACVEELRPLLNDSVYVGADLGWAVKDQLQYYEVHGNLPKLKRWKPAA